MDASAFAASAIASTLLAGMSERDAAKRIADDDLDILVDLSTHTKGAKPGILAFKPARVQITHVASAGTVGLSADRFQAHRPLRRPSRRARRSRSRRCCRWRVASIRIVTSRRPPSIRSIATRLGIPDDAVVIGAFVSALKLSRRCLALWREVLERIPRARLAFSPANPAARGALSARSPARPESRRSASCSSRRAATTRKTRHVTRLVDFVLDPMPFGGVNGTLEALDMGVPVVTLVGDRHGERTGYSILANLGVTDTVAKSGPEYVEIAVRLATDPRLHGGRARRDPQRHRDVDADRHAAAHARPRRRLRDRVAAEVVPGVVNHALERAGVAVEIEQLGPGDSTLQPPRRVRRRRGSSTYARSFRK